MLLARQDIEAEIKKKKIRFDPPIEARQWATGGASINLRLGTKITTFADAPNVKFSLSQGISALSDTGLWNEEDLSEPDSQGRPKTFTLRPGDFVLGLT